MAIQAVESPVFDKTTLLAFVSKAIDHNLVRTWIPALAGMIARLDAGATVAVIGGSIKPLQRAFPTARFSAFDADNTRYPAPMRGYDLIVVLGGYPDRASARRARDTIAPGGAVLILEPVAADHRLRDILTFAGFRTVFRVDETPFHRVFAARP
jgi:hypothetical protein